MAITPVQITGLEAMLNAIASMFLPAGAVVALTDAEEAFNIISGDNPPIAPLEVGTITNHLAAKFALVIVPITGPIGTTYSITI